MRASLRRCHKTLRSIVLLSSLAATTLLMVGCDRLQTVVYVNETDQALQFYLKTDAMGPLKGSIVPAHSSEEVHVMVSGRDLRVVARREDHRPVFDRTYTWEELEKLEGRVVVSSLEPVPEPK